MAILESLYYFRLVLVSDILKSIQFGRLRVDFLQILEDLRGNTAL